MLGWRFGLARFFFTGIGHINDRFFIFLDNFQLFCHISEVLDTLVCIFIEMLHDVKVVVLIHVLVVGSTNLLFRVILFAQEA
jgi:hypothetical protein